MMASACATMATCRLCSETFSVRTLRTVKYYNAQIAHEYKKIEKIAQHKLIEMLPPELQDARCCRPTVLQGT
jgi:5'-deoxynucleotidase